MRSIFEKYNNYHPYVWDDFLYIQQGQCIHLLHNLVRKKGPKFLCFCGSLIEVHRGVFTTETLEVPPGTCLCSACAIRLPELYLNSHLASVFGIMDDDLILRETIERGFLRNRGYLYDRRH